MASNSGFASLLKVFKSKFYTISRSRYFLRTLGSQQRKTFHTNIAQFKGRKIRNAKKSFNRQNEQVQLTKEKMKTPIFDDPTPLSDILRPHFDHNNEKQEKFYQNVVRMLEENGLFDLRDWKGLTDPNLKKQFGVKVINALDMALGSQLFVELKKLEEELHTKAEIVSDKERDQMVKNFFKRCNQLFPSPHQNNDVPSPEALAKILMPIIESSEFDTKMNNPPVFKDPAIQADLLGEFNNPSMQLPLGKVDNEAFVAMQLATLSEELWAPDVKEYVDHITTGKFGDILLKVMGAGKTARLIAISTRMYMVYIACAKKDDQQSAIFDGTIALLFQNLERMADMERIREAKREVLIYYLSRIMYLYTILKIRPKLTPTEFTIFQLNGFGVSIGKIYRILRDHLNISHTSESAMELSIIEVISMIQGKVTKPLAIALDELQMTAELLKDQFISTVSGKRRSAMAMLIEPLIGFSHLFRYYGFAGTSMTLSRVPGLLTPLGKLSYEIMQIRTIVDHSYLNLDEFIHLLSRHIDIEDCKNFMKNEAVFAKVVGRKRLFANFILMLNSMSKKISEEVKENASKKTEIKQKYLHLVALKTAEGMTAQLVTYIENKLKSELYKDKVIEGLKYVIVASVLFPNIRIINRKHAEIIELGLCQLSDVYYDENGKNIQTIKCITEVFVMDACRQVLPKLGLNELDLVLEYASDLLSMNLSSPGQASARGTAIEPFIALNIGALYRDKIFSQIPFISGISGIFPSWINDVKFKIQNFNNMKYPMIGSTERLFGIDTKEYFKKLGQSIKNQEWEQVQLLTSVVLVHLSQTIHPDIAIVEFHQGKLYFILFSLKLYPNSKIDVHHSYASTQLDRFWMNYYDDDKQVLATEEWLDFVNNYLGWIDPATGMVEGECIVGGIVRVHIHLGTRLENTKDIGPLPVVQQLIENLNKFKVNKKQTQITKTDNLITKLNHLNKNWRPNLPENQVISIDLNEIEQLKMIIKDKYALNTIIDILKAPIK